MLTDPVHGSGRFHRTEICSPPDKSALQSLKMKMEILPKVFWWNITEGKKGVVKIIPRN